MKTVQQTIQNVRASMEINVAGARAEKAAVDYAALCREAEQRLETVSVILEQGSVYQALQAAEQDPPLLSLVAALNFGGEKAWQTFCAVHQLEIAPRLPSATVQRLDALYAKGITANHPLYKDFRAAVLSRDDAKALQIVRAILRLDSGDDNARKELQRIENKHRQELLNELKTALKSGDDEKVSALAGAVAATGDEEKLMRYETYSEGDRIRRALRRRQAEAALPHMLAEMTEKHQHGDWMGVGRFLEKIADAVAEHGLDLSEGPLHQPIQEMTAYYDRSLAAYEHQQKFNVMLGAFSAFADEVEVRLMTGAGVSYQEVVAKDETFVRQWKELEALNLPVPADTLQRLQTVGQELRGRLEQLEKFRKRRTMAGLTAALVALLVLAGMGWFSWKAASLARELNDYVIKKNCAPAETLVTELRKNGGLLMKWPKLQATVEEVDAWARQARIAEKEMAAKLQTIGIGVTTMPPEQLVQELADAESMIAELPQDLALAQKRTFDELNTSAGLRVAEIRQEKKVQAEGGIKKLEQAAERELSFELPTVAVAAAIGRLNEQFRPFEELLTPVTEGLQLPADLSSRIIALRQKLTGFEDELKAFDQLREEAVSSTSLNEYKAALGKWQSVKFTEAGHALKALDVVPTEEVFLAILLTGADKSKLKFLKEDKAAAPMMPAEPKARDINALLSLRNDQNLNNIYEHLIVDHNSNEAIRVVFSQDELKTAYLGGENIKWTGIIYDPALSERSVDFKKREFVKITGTTGLRGEEVRSSKLSGVSQLMNVLLLNELMDHDREKFERPLLPLIGKITEYKDTPPLASAFLMLKLSEIVLSNGDEWGGAFSTTFLADHRKLSQIEGVATLKSGDWMVPVQRRKFEASIASFFADAGQSYLLEATKRRNLLRVAALAGLRFAGFIEADGRLLVNQSGWVESELWALSKEGDTALMFSTTSTSAAAEGGSVFMVPQAMPLSPVYSIPLDRKKLVQNYHAALNAAGISSKEFPENSMFISIP